MRTLTFQVIYDNQIYTYKSGTEAMIFDYGVNNDLDRKHDMQALKEYVALVYELYLSDSNDLLSPTKNKYANEWRERCLRNAGEI